MPLCKLFLNCRCISTYKSFISMFPKDFNTSYCFFLGMTFAGFRYFCFTISFRDNSNFHYWLLKVVSCLSHIGENSLLADVRNRFNWEHSSITQFGVPCSAILSANHCYQNLVDRISIILWGRNCLVILWEGDLSCLKVLYTRNHWVTWRDFMQSFYSYSSTEH